MTGDDAQPAGEVKAVVADTSGAGAHPGVRIYRPDNRMADGPWTALRHLVTELVRFRSHIRTMFRQSFRNSTRGTRLGVLWNYALPLVPVSVYVALSSFRVLPSFADVPGGLYVALGVTVWFFFAGCVQQPVTVVQSRNSEAMKTSLPLGASIAASFAGLIFDTLVRAAFIAVLAVVLGVLPSALAPLALPVFAAGALFFLSAGLILSILNIVYPDVQRVVAVVLQYGIFVSGVIFPATALGPLDFLAWANPFTVFIGAVRDLALLGRLGDPLPLLVMTGVGAGLVLLAARIFYVMEQRIRGVV